MKIQLRYPMRFGKLLYKPGVHEFPDEMKKDWFMLSLIANKKAAIIGDAPVKKVPSLPPMKEPESPLPVIEEEKKPKKAAKKEEAKKKDE